MSRKNSMILKLEYKGNLLYEKPVDELPNIIRIGRSHDNTWILPGEDHFASTHHAQIEKKGSKLYLVDLGSRNGIYFQGARIEKSVKMHPGSIYAVGDSKLTLEKAVDSTQHVAHEAFHRLEQLSGANKGKIYKITKELFWIGSDKICDIVLADSLVSHKQAQLLNKPDGSCWICDGTEDGTPSKNGTRVNQTPVSSLTSGGGRMLKDGDIISIAYVDFRFWDRNVLHVRSHVLLKTAIVIITLAIVIGSYLGIQSMLPSAKRYRLLAEKAASAGNFQQAYELVELAADARGSDADAMQRSELLRKLKLWQETSTQWNRIIKMLSKQKGQNWQYINSLFTILTHTGNENWKWNSTSALEQMKVAQETQELLSCMLTAESFLQSSSNDFQYLETITQRLARITAKCNSNPLKFRTSLSQRADSILKELQQTKTDHEEASRLIDGFDDIERTTAIYEKISEIRKRNSDRIAQHKKAGSVYSTAVIQFCDNLLIPLDGLNESYGLLQENFRKIACLELLSLHKDLPLPTPQQCMVSQNLSTRCDDLLKMKERQELIVRQLANFKKLFSDHRIYLGQKSEILSELFRPESLAAVLDCDCLRKKQPGYKDKTASSLYDRWLGVNVFFEYLRSLDGDFDISILEDRSTPLLFQTTELFDLLNTFLNFCYAKENTPLAADLKKIREISPGKNKILKLILQSENLLQQKTTFLRKLLQIYLTEPDTRKGIIAGGMLCYLHTSSENFVPPDFKKQISQKFRTLRRKVIATLDIETEKTPEMRIRNETKVLETGIPGDPYLRQPWNDAIERTRGEKQ